MVGAKVIVVRSGTEKSPGNNKGLRGIISAVSQKCYYISYEKLIINSSPSSLATLTKSPSSSVLDFPPQSFEIMTGGTKVKPVEITTVSPKAATATATAAAGKRQESSIQISCNHNNDNFNLMVADTISDCDTPEMKNVNKPVWEEVNWVRKMTVIKVIKSSSVLAVILPNLYKKPRRGKTGEVLKIVDNNEDENGKTFLLYGREHMQFSGSS